MRITVLALLGVLAVAVPVVSAYAGPRAPAPAPADVSNIVQIAGGCGAGFHRYYEPWNRPSPSDYVARELNAQQLYRGPWGY